MTDLGRRQHSNNFLWDEERRQDNLTLVSENYIKALFLEFTKPLWAIAMLP